MRIEIYGMDENGRERVEVSRLSGEDELRNLALVVCGMCGAEQPGVGDLMDKIYLGTVNEKYYRYGRKGGDPPEDVSEMQRPVGMNPTLFRQEKLERKK